MPVNIRSARPGYVFLIAVLFIGAMAIATTVSLLLLGWASELTGDSGQHGAQALLAAESCLREGIYRVRNHPSLEYTGSKSLTFPPTTGSCALLVIGSGNNDRLFCATGYATGVKGLHVRRVVAKVKTVIPLVYEHQKEVQLYPPCFTASSSSAVSISSSSSSL